MEHSVFSVCYFLPGLPQDFSHMLSLEHLFLSDFKLRPQRDVVTVFTSLQRVLIRGHVLEARFHLYTVFVTHFVNIVRTSVHALIASMLCARLQILYVSRHVFVKRFDLQLRILKFVSSRFLAVCRNLDEQN